MSTSPQRLWDKGAALDELVHRFTVGDDPQLDRHLVHWDCVGSAAHARTLARAGLISGDELSALLGGLAEIEAQDRNGKFEIPAALEDCHTAIEAALTARLGEVGEKIHTGRSRNDQVATAMRLYMRRHALDWVELLGALATTLLDRIERDGATPMPGYTHMQPAMPSSIGQWLHAFVEAALEEMRATRDLLDRLDCCPLGTGAGFGVPLPLDREYAAKLLDFSRVQRSAIDVQNSRGRFETYFVRVAVDCAALLEKLSWDLILFSSAEYGFFSLPESMTTGSSIMPQKRNPDVLELLRGRAGRLRGRLHELEWVAGKLPSSYHRDLQLTKGPTIQAAIDLAELLLVGERVVALFTVNADRLHAALRPELYATAAAYELVQQGTPFRQGYRQIADEVRGGRFGEQQAARIRSNNNLQRPEAVGAAILTQLREELSEHRSRAIDALARLSSAEQALLSAPP